MNARDEQTLVAFPGQTAPAECRPQPERAVAACEQSAPKQVGLDAIDRLPVAVLPDNVRRAAEPTMLAGTQALCGDASERKAAMIRILARTVQQSRVQLRYFEARRNQALANYLEGQGPAQRVDILERAVGRQHRRLFDALEMFRRMDPPVNQIVRVTTDRAAILFQGGYNAPSD